MKGIYHQLKTNIANDDSAVNRLHLLHCGFCSPSAGFMEWKFSNMRHSLQYFDEDFLATVSLTILQKYKIAKEQFQYVNAVLVILTNSLCYWDCRSFDG